MVRRGGEDSSGEGTSWLVLRHTPAEGLGLLANPLREFGIHHRYLDLPRGEALPRDLRTVGGLIVLGGTMAAYEADRHPFLATESTLIERLLTAGRPVLGICLGAQLIAKAAHSWVGPAPEPEIGWYEVELTEAGLDDPVLGRLPARFEAFQWHYYTHGLPAGARELACNDNCIQGLRLGERVWGVQFHPEVTLAQIEGWCVDPEDPPPDAEKLLAETRPRIEQWNELGRTLCDAFCAIAERARAAA